MSRSRIGDTKKYSLRSSALKPELKQLKTYGHESPPEAAWDEHPRPQFRRARFLSLNGCWEFAAGAAGSDSFPEEFSKTIRVPFPVEASLSGIGKHFPEGTPLWYRRQLPEVSVQEGESVLLHIDAVDQEANVFVNDTFAAHIHTFQGRNGIDITPYLTDANALTIRVTDDLSRKAFPYGKQTLKRGGMWYTPFSGIWQSVWLEVVPRDPIRGVRIHTSLTEAVVEVEGPESGTVLFEDHEIPYQNGSVVLRPKDPVCWTPDTPQLYSFTIRAGKDEVQSYFALRTLSVQTESGVPRLFLNGKPFFFHGLLDQGYWPDGICTPPDPACFNEDIQAMKELGFNTLRKHIKLEPERFYYDCDRLGMIVFQDMVNNGSYSFFRDTFLPTVGIKKLSDHGINRDPACRNMFLDCMEQTVSLLYNHPSICCWTIFNEGWGQFDADEAHDKLKALDDSRIIDTASGWFVPKNSDVSSLHVYFKPFRLPASDKPVLLSEFGGYSCKIPAHSFNLSKTYGYRFFKDPALFMDALEKLYLGEILPAAKAGLSGAIYTQVSDVEDETNGLLTYDRALCKVDRPRMRAISEKILFEFAGPKV